jgi:hypothetical protein
MLIIEACADRSFIQCPRMRPRSSSLATQADYTNTHRNALAKQGSISFLKKRNKKLLLA